MSPLQKIQMKQSEEKKALGLLLEKTEHSDEENKELETRTENLKNLETQWQAAQMIEPDEPAEVLKDSSEGKELKSILSQSKITNYINEAVFGVPLPTPDLELRTESFGGKDLERHIPLEMLLDGPLETRADAVTNIASTDSSTPENLVSLVGRIFPDSSSEYLGLRQITANPGIAKFGRLSSGTISSYLIPGAELAGTEATIETVEAEPHRITASYTISRESIEILGNQLEVLLKEDLRRVIRDRTDYLVIRGAVAVQDTSPAIQGILDGTTFTAPSDETAISTWVQFLEAYDSAVTGKEGISTAEQVKLLVNSNTFLHANSLLVGSSANASMLLRDRLQAARFRVSAQMPATDATTKNALAIRYAGNRQTALNILWKNLEILSDPYTLSAKGQRIIRIIGMQNLTFTDTTSDSPYSVLKFRTST